MTSVIVADDYSPITVGDTGAPFAPVFAHRDGTAVNLSGATITMRMDNGEGTVKDAAGTWTIDDASGGLAHYAYDAADVNEAGMWTLSFTVSVGGKPVHGDKKLLQILLAT